MNCAQELDKESNQDSRSAADPPLLVTEPEAMPNRNAGPPERYNPSTGNSYAQMCHHIVTQTTIPSQKLEYDKNEIGIVANIITHLKDKYYHAQHYNGKGTRDWISKEDKTSPTVSNESIMITYAIDAYEKRNIITLDIPNAFIQTKTPKKEVRGKNHDENQRKISRLVSQ